MSSNTTIIIFDELWILMIKTVVLALATTTLTLLLVMVAVEY